MVTLTTQTYDPHLLYHAIGITVELEYKVPMQKVYAILSAATKTDSKNIPSPSEIQEMLTAMGSAIENSSTEESDLPDTNSLQAKIKEMLRLLGCDLPVSDLNKILKGDLAIENVLSKQAQTAWRLVFSTSADGRVIPNKDTVELVFLCTQSIALENVERKIDRVMQDYRARNTQPIERHVLEKGDNLKTVRAPREIKEDPVELDRKRAKLKLYIAHMQGYDRDRDHDGGRGIDMSTGDIIDFADIYMSDKQGHVIDDIAHDGIDLSDIR